MVKKGYNLCLILLFFIVANPLYSQQFELLELSDEPFLFYGLECDNIDLSLNKNIKNIEDNFIDTTQILEISDTIKHLDPFAIPKHIGPRLAVKSNAVYWAILTPNVGAEYAFKNNWSVAIDLVYDPITIFKSNMVRVSYVQPEVKYWFSTQYVEHAVSASLFGGVFNRTVGVSVREQGNMYGIALNYSYSWVLTSRLNLEVTAGLGYVYLQYNKLYKVDNRPVVSGYRNYVGPTRFGVNLVYFFGKNN